MRDGILFGMPQIAVRLTAVDLARLDESVARGRYASRAAAVRAGLERVLREERDRDLAEAYRRGYGAQPAEAAFGQAGLELMAEAVRAEEQPRQADGR